MLSSTLRKIDGQSYKRYRELLGKREKIKNLELSFIRVQGDPFATPSVLKITAPFTSSYPFAPVEDYIYRRLHSALSKESMHGEGHSGFLGIPRASHAMLRRTGVRIENGKIEMRIWFGLPARRRRVIGDMAEELLFLRVPRAVEKALSYPDEELKEHVIEYEIQEQLRKNLKKEGLIAFVGNGSILPRSCGDCETPLKEAIPFKSPPELEVELETSHGSFAGMGIKKGITVIAGTAFHGKSTLLNAIRDGIYNHIPGDGRERVVSIKDTFKIRAEDGRSIRCVDISSFIYNLPDGRDTECFTTDNASGATSMASGIQEMVESGIKAILIDEDSSATNLLFYDSQSSKLFRHKTVSTITEKARAMKDAGISLVIVSSGTMPILRSGDTVIIMEDYRPRVVNVERTEDKESYSMPRARILMRIPEIRKLKIHGSWLTSKELKRPIRMENNEQVYEDSQLCTIAKIMENGKSMEGLKFSEIREKVENMDIFLPRSGPEYGEIRGVDFLFALNRISEIKVKNQ